MKVVYHQDYTTVYASNPAAEAGRMKSITDEIGEAFEFVTPKPATESTLALVHTEDHINSIRRKKPLYNIALLAVGGAVKAGNIAMEGEPTFGLIRPPGHHAHPARAWGFCYFNNIAIAVEALRRERIQQATIIDFDLHFGDGTAEIYDSVPQVTYFHVPDQSRSRFHRELDSFLASIQETDLIAVSAGFDRHKQDWGGVLSTNDYKQVGRKIRETAKEKCDGRRFALLEGGYNHNVLGENVSAFLYGLQGGVNEGEEHTEM